MAQFPLNARVSHPADGLPYQKISGTTHATPGTRTTHSYAALEDRWGYAIDPTQVIIVPKATDSDTADAGVVSFVKIDTTAKTIVVKGSAASLAFDAYIR